ncbi:MAG: CPXCG motif-containing cysteine-rich protein [bacterium]
MTEPLQLSCPYCGEAVDLDVDESGGSRQSYVEDCPVCCRPWQVDVVRDRDGGWNATLRTADE